MKGGRTAPRDLPVLSDSCKSACASMKGGRTAPRDMAGLGSYETAAELQ